MSILNLTQHAASAEQAEAGVVEPTAEIKSKVRSLLTFTSLPSKSAIVERARALATVAQESGCKAAMIGGAPYLMGPLEAALRGAGVRPLYAFSKRDSVEVTENGATVKRVIFRHLGFVEV